MKILLLSDPNSVHTQKWAKSLSDNGNIVHIFGISDYEKEIYKDYPGIKIQTLGLPTSTLNSKHDSNKLRYLKAIPILKDLINVFKPDILHAHYATSYGLLGALTGFHPFILSVWGSDVFDFPQKSFMHRKLLRYNLKKADQILSTSHIMANETRRYTDKHIEVTPFGIDLEIFKPMKVTRPFQDTDIVIGTVKTLDEKYGIQYLIRAFKILKEKHPNLPLKLLIVGGGPQEDYLHELVNELDIQHETVFTGKVDFKNVPTYHNMLDISVFVSTLDSESFGVAVIEAGACEKPVVVSNVGGLPEVVEEEVTGLIVYPKSPKETAKAIERLILNSELRATMGIKARERVKQIYNWQDNLNQMEEIYKRFEK